MPGNESDNGKDELRKRAEALVSRTHADVGKMSADEVAKLVYELQVHQIELEAQNESLRETQQLLAETRDRYRDLYEFAPVGYLTLDTAGIIVAANLTAASLLGVDRSTLTGQRFMTFVEPKSRDTAFRHFGAADAELLKQSCELKLKHNEQAAPDVKVESVARLEGGQVVGYRTTLTDITELKETQSRLENLNQELDAAVRERTSDLTDQRDFDQTLIDTARTIILVLDTEGHIVSFNHFMEEISGYTLAEVRGKHWVSTFLPERDRAWSENLLENTDGTLFRRNTNAILTKDGREREIEWQDAEILGPNGEVKGLLCTGHDVTERQSLQQQLLTILEQEHQRIGAHLHDDLGQELVALRLIAEMLIDAMREHDSPDLNQAMKLSEGLARAVADVRELSHGLVLFTVKATDFVPELQRLCNQFRDFDDIDCKCNLDADIIVPDDQISNQLYHIAKEAMTNALKHGRVDGLHTGINLYTDGDDIVLEVRDNGLGIPDDKPSLGNGAGLRIMRRRARLIDGTLDVGSHPEGGTLVVCRVPRE